MLGSMSWLLTSMAVVGSVGVDEGVGDDDGDDEAVIMVDGETVLA